MKLCPLATRQKSMISNTEKKGSIIMTAFLFEFMGLTNLFIFSVDQIESVSFTDDKISYQSELKVFAADKIMVQISKFVSER